MTNISQDFRWKSQYYCRRQCEHNITIQFHYRCSSRSCFRIPPGIRVDVCSIFIESCSNLYLGIDTGSYWKQSERQDRESLEKAVWSVIDSIKDSKTELLDLSHERFLISEDGVLILHFPMTFDRNLTLDPMHPARTISFFGKSNSIIEEKKLKIQGESNIFAPPSNAESLQISHSCGVVFENNLMIFGGLNHRKQGF